MCHVTNLSVVNTERLRAMPREYRQKLEDRLENGPYTPSTRKAVTPIFEEVYAAWQAREATRKAIRPVGKPEAESAITEVTPGTIIPVYVGGELMTILTEANT